MAAVRALQFGLKTFILPPTRPASIGPGLVMDQLRGLGEEFMRAVCVGGGPAGLYFALAMKQDDPAHDITVFERSTAGSTYGWGVVLWRDLLQKLYQTDPSSARQIDQATFRWVSQVVDVHGKQVIDAASTGYSINRQLLLNILASRAQELGVRVEFNHEVMTREQLPDADLIVACDGVVAGSGLTAGRSGPA